VTPSGGRARGGGGSKGLCPRPPPPPPPPVRCNYAPDSGSGSGSGAVGRWARLKKKALGQCQQGSARSLAGAARSLALAGGGGPIAGPADCIAHSQLSSDRTRMGTCSSGFVPSVDASAGVGGHDCILHCALLLVTRHTKVAHTGHRSEGFGLRLRLRLLVGFGFVHHMHAGTASTAIEYTQSQHHSTIHVHGNVGRPPLLACSC
jgi:hypothetical protein